MFADFEGFALEPVGLGKAENHDPAKGTQPQQVEIREIADQSHGRAMRCRETIANAIEFITISINFR